MVFSILILLDPFSDVRQFAIRVLHMFFGRRIRQSETCYLHDDIRGHEGLSEEDDRVPAMTPSLNALVTDADVNHFLEELGSAPTAAAGTTRSTGVSPSPSRSRRTRHRSEPRRSSRRVTPCCQ